MITVALPKGRIADDTLAIFRKIFGLDFKFEDRKLIMSEGNFKFLYVRNQDIPTYVVGGAADIGVVGLDVLEEHRPDVLRLLDLKIGKCKVCVGIKNETELNYGVPGIKIATKMPNITREYFAQKAIAVSIIKLYGSIELAPLIGLADAIVDNVETGTTLKQNGLKVAETIMESSAHLIANRNSFVIKRDEILDLREKIAKEIGL
ncbi:MAG: ATP phosphoribosyltransferase [Campylobacter sp.]|nr:ATP phosphoribosyltransferase [Campylobacter sp.]